MCCRGGPRGTTLLFQTSTGLRAGASSGGLERRGLLLLKVQQVGSDLGELLMVLMLLLPLLLDQLLEIRQIRRCLGEEGLPLLQVHGHSGQLTLMLPLSFCSFELQLL